MKPTEQLNIEKLLQGYKIEYKRVDENVYVYAAYRNDKLELLREINKVIDRNNLGPQSYHNQVVIMDMMKYNELIRKMKNGPK